MFSPRLFLAAGLLVVLLAACGGDTDEDGGSATTATPTAASATATTVAATPPPDVSPTTDPTATQPSSSPTVPETGGSIEYEHVASWGGPVFPQRPADVHVTENGTVYVIDTARAEVQVYDPAGELTARWGPPEIEAGMGTTQPSSIPVLVAVDQAGNVYTLDASGSQLMKFGPDGAALAEFYFEEGEQAKRDLEIGPDGRLYAVSGSSEANGNSTTTPGYGVYVFDQDLNKVAFWEAPPDRAPLGITFDAEGQALLLTTTPIGANPNIPLPAAQIVTIDSAAYDPADWTDNAIEIEQPVALDGLLAGPDGRLFLVHQRNGNYPPEPPTAFYEVDEAGTVVASWEVNEHQLVAFENAPGVDVGPDGLIYLADPAHNRVLKISTGGEIQGELSGVEPGTLAFPFGIVVGPDGNVYVVDDGLGRVSAFSPDGTLLDERAYLVPRPHFIATHNDIAVTENGDIHYVSPRAIPAEAWQRLASNGETTTIEVDELMELERDNGQFMFNPHSVAIGADGLVYIAMDQQPWVRSYTTDGELVEEWPQGDASGETMAVAAGPDAVFALVWTSLGDTDQQDGAIIVPVGGDPTVDAVASFTLGEPSGSDDTMTGMITALAIDADGNFYVLEQMSGDVIMLAPDGTVLSRWNTLVGEESEPFQMRTLAVDDEGRVFVVDGATRQVHVFEPVSD